MMVLFALTGQILYKTVKREEMLMNRNQTLGEICKRFEAMGQPNSGSVVLLADELQAEGSWDQGTLDELRQKAQAECAKGPNQMIMGWPGHFRNAAT